MASSKAVSGEPKAHARNQGKSLHMLTMYKCSSGPKKLCMLMAQGVDQAWNGHHRVARHVLPAQSHSEILALLARRVHLLFLAMEAVVWAIQRQLPLKSGILGSECTASSVVSVANLCPLQMDCMTRSP